MIFKGVTASFFQPLSVFRKKGKDYIFYSINGNLPFAHCFLGKCIYNVFTVLKSCSNFLQGSSSKKRVHYKSYDPSLMEKAMAAVQHDGKTMYRAAKDCGVPMNTLRDRLIAKGLFKPKRPVVYHEVCIICEL